MGHIIQVELPPEVFEQVAKKAHKNGKTPEQQVADWAQANATSIADEIEEVPPDPNDPLEKLFGTVDIDVPDINEEHSNWGPVEVHPQDIPVGADPVERWFGSITGVPPDWAHNHDYYIALDIAECKMPSLLKKAK